MEYPIFFAIIAIVTIIPAGLAGLIIIIRFLLWIDRAKYYRSSLYQLDKMSQEDFETAVKEKLQSVGYSISKPRAESAASIIATVTKRGKMMGKTTAVVVFKAKTKAPCQLKIIESAIDAKKKHKASFGMVITNAFLTNEAVQAALENEIVVWDRQKLDCLFYGGNWFFSERFGRFLTEVFNVG